jgi:nucleotide-binding universal stress UspA family protein
MLVFADWDRLLKVKVKTEVIVGDPKEKICEATANHNADLLVMGCRAIGPLQR